MRSSVIVSVLRSIGVAERADAVDIGGPIADVRELDEAGVEVGVAALPGEVGIDVGEGDPADLLVMALANDCPLSAKHSFDGLSGRAGDMLAVSTYAVSPSRTMQPAEPTRSTPCACEMSARPPPSVPAGESSAIASSRSTSSRVTSTTHVGAARLPWYKNGGTAASGRRWISSGVSQASTNTRMHGHDHGRTTEFSSVRGSVSV